MVTITTNYGTFEAESLKEAKALASKKEREENKRMKERDANYRTALTRAKARAYDVLVKTANGEDMPRGWRLKMPGTRYCIVETTVSEITGRRSDKATYETEDGRIVHDHGWQCVEGIVWTGNGFDILVFLRENGRGDVCYAIGVCGDVIAFAEVPGMTLYRFESHKEQ